MQANSQTSSREPPLMLIASLSLMLGCMVFALGLYSISNTAPAFYFDGDGSVRLSIAIAGLLWFIGGVFLYAVSSSFPRRWNLIFELFGGICAVIGAVVVFTAVIFTLL